MEEGVFPEHKGKKWEEELTEAMLLEHPNIETVEVYDPSDAIFAIARPKTAMVFVEKDGTVAWIDKGDPLEKWKTDNTE